MHMWRRCGIKGESVCFLRWEIVSMSVRRWESSGREGALDAGEREGNRSKLLERGLYPAPRWTI